MNICEVGTDLDDAAIVLLIISSDKIVHHGESCIYVHKNKVASDVIRSPSSIPSIAIYCATGQCTFKLNSLQVFSAV